MTYTVKEVMEIVKSCLGENVNGIYIDNMRLQFHQSYCRTIFVNSDFSDVLRESELATFAAGCTKVVLIPYGKDYVIKLPIVGTYKEDEEKGMAVGYIADRNVFRRENRLLSQSNDEVINEMVLPNVYVGEYCGIPVYVQEAVAVVDEDFNGEVKPETEEITKIVDRAMEGEGGLTRNFLTAIANRYGESGIWSVQGAMDYELYDLHDGNCGYMTDGRPVIFDIGGCMEVWFADESEEDYGD